MKNHISLLNLIKYFAIFTLGIFILIISCDKIEPPYTVNNENIDTSKCPVPQFPALGTVYKKILIEDFTGHKCGYCPRAHVALKNLIDTYGDKIVGVALHVSDWYASPDANGLFTYDFRTTEGTDIDVNFHVSDGGLPKGMINRTKYNNNVVIDHTSWATVVQSMLTEQPKIGMQIINQYNNVNDSSFCSHIKITFLENITDTLMFFCGLMEDSITKPQKNYDVTPNEIPAYNHMHVFRDGLNGSFGVLINPQLTKKDSSITKSYYYDFHGKDYQFKNLKIFAYVYKFSNNNYQEVYQVEESKVME